MLWPMPVVLRSKQHIDKGIEPLTLRTVQHPSSHSREEVGPSDATFATLAVFVVTDAARIPCSLLPAVPDVEVTCLCCRCC